MKPSTFFKHLRPRYLWANRYGHCPVCGNATLFLMTGAPEAVRNGAVCVRCGSCSRNRHIARLAVAQFAGSGAASMKELGRVPGMGIYHTSLSGPIFKALGRGPNVVCADFIPDVERGTVKDGRLCQDLERLTFPDGGFDLVLSEDVFEHLEDYRAGFREVHRVLKKGGAHVFSIPFYFDRKTRDLWSLADGKKVLHEPIEYHGDPLRGTIPCFTHFGYDLIEFLERTGFTVRIEISGFAEIGRIGTFDCYSFVAIKA